MWAMIIQASAEAIDFSKSLTNLRLLPSHAKARSTTQRRGRTSKPLALSVRLTIWRVNVATFCSAPLSLGSRHRRRYVRAAAALEDGFEDGRRAVTILNIGAVNYEADDQSQRVDDNVTHAPVS